MPSSQTTAYVVMYGDTPRAVATDLLTALDSALASQTEWVRSSEWGYRWDEYTAGSVWRLMQRRKDVAGKGRRYSWTQYAVHTVDSLGGAR